MRPKRIILIRHAESEGNVDHKRHETVPGHKLQLTDKGHAQALAAGKELKTIIGDEKIHVYLSPFDRTQQTFEGLQNSVNDNVTKVYQDPRLREQDWGHLRLVEDSQPIAEERDQFGTFYYRVKDGESGADVFDRVSTFLDTMHRDFQKDSFPDNALVVTHGLTMRLFLMRWFHWTVEEYEALRNPHNCQIVVMERQDDYRYRLTQQMAQRAE